MKDNQRIEEPEIERDANGKVRAVRLVFGPHHFVEVMREAGWIRFSREPPPRSSMTKRSPSSVFAISIECGMYAQARQTPGSSSYVPQSHACITTTPVWSATSA